MSKSCPVDGCPATSLDEHARLVVEGTPPPAAEKICAELRNALGGLDLKDPDPTIERLHALATALAEIERRQFEVSIGGRFVADLRRRTADGRWIVRSLPEMRERLLAAGVISLKSSREQPGFTSCEDARAAVVKALS